MATPTEVEKGMLEITNKIDSCRSRLKRAKSRIEECRAELAAIPAEYGDVLTTIGAYTGADDVETFYQADLIRKTGEFIALRDDAALAVTDLAERTEF